MPKYFNKLLPDLFKLDQKKNMILINYFSIFLKSIYKYILSSISQINKLLNKNIKKILKIKKIEFFKSTYYKPIKIFIYY